jgi:putative ABC transport system ATP-binding protein
VSSLIRASGLRKTYRSGSSEVHALRGVDLAVERGAFVALIGASGSGKSSLLHILGCLDRPDEGSYELDGTPVSSLSDRELSRVRNERIGFVFQALNLIPQHRVVENVELPLVYAGVAAPVRRRRAEAILEQVGLGGKMHRRPTELSGGEAQRVAIARALVIDPLLVFADEPTGSLDTRTGDEIMAVFADLHRRGTTLVIVTHNKEVAEQAERIIEMRDGAIVADWTTFDRGPR